MPSNPGRFYPKQPRTLEAYESMTQCLLGLVYMLSPSPNPSEPVFRVCRIRLIVSALH